MTEEITLEEKTKTASKRPLLQKVRGFILSLCWRWKGLTTLKKVVLGSVVVILLILLPLAIICLRGSGSVDSTLPDGMIDIIREGDDSELIPPEEPRDQPAPVDGVLVTEEEMEEIEGRRPLAVVVENHTLARPTFGLNRADLVYEGLVEGGITRFVAVYLRNQTDKIGPVRSLRTYHMDWVAEFNDPLVMHIGYAPPAPQSDPSCDVLAYIHQKDVKSLGLLGHYYWRVQDRKPPHNAFTKTDKLWENARNLGWEGLKDFETWVYKDEASLEERGLEQSVSVNWDGWGANAYSVRWVYDQNQNRYLRYDGGVESKDAGSGEQVWAKNVIVQMAAQTVVGDSLNHIMYQSTGEGPAFVLRDGQKVEGKWKKENRLSRMRFYDAEDKEVALNRGRSWILVAPHNSEVTF